ncbi:MAG: ATP-binding protein [Acidobacteria bacterium]|nr:ATP-binding protein [Acidobacteriota bacterium]
MSASILDSMTGLLVLLAGALLIWAVSSKRRLRTQTRFILRQIETEVVLEKRYHDLFENAHDVIYTHDLSGRLTSFNKAAERLTGYSQDEAKAMNRLDLTLPERRLALRQWIDQLAGGSEVTTVEVEVVSRSGRRSILEVNARLIHQGGKPLEVEAIGRDVTDRKRVEAELERARRGVETGARMKDQFLANMSHEIRTPLNGVIGLTALLLEGELRPQQREYLEMVKSSADSLMTLINDILDFSKIEAGKFQLDPVEFLFREYLAEAIRLIQLRALQKGIEMNMEVGGEVPQKVIGDPGRLRQVLLNLLGNAVKFTGQGKVLLSIGAEQRDLSSTLLHFVVKDTGIGILLEKQSSIFEAFSQADGSTTRQYGGTGLGLAICSQLVALMGGNIWVESELGKGSCFHFTARFNLPGGESEHHAEAAVVNEPEATPPENSGHLRILLAEDNVVNQRLVQGVLERYGYSVTTAWNGLEVLRALERQPFDLVLMDVQMPELDGLEATGRIRRNEAAAGGPRLPIIAMTAHALIGDRERCLEAGMDEYISKPVRPADLLRVIAEVTGKAATGLQ